MEFFSAKITFFPILIQHKSLRCHNNFSQVDGEAMGYWKIIWPEKYFKKFRPIYYKKFLDDIFLLFEKPEYLQLFLAYMNKEHPHIKFSNETRKNLVLPFYETKA